MTKLPHNTPRRLFRFSALLLSLVLCGSSLLTPSAFSQSPGLSKISPALQQALTSTQDLVWLNQSRGTARVLIQTNGSVSLSLLTSIVLNGGLVVKSFSSIDAVLVERSEEHTSELQSR